MNLTAGCPLTFWRNRLNLLHFLVLILLGTLLCLPVEARHRSNIRKTHAHSQKTSVRSGHRHKKKKNRHTAFVKNKSKKVVSHKVAKIEKTPDTEIDYGERVGPQIRVYKLRDKALNEQMENNYGVALHDLQLAAEESQSSRNNSSADALLYLDLAHAAQAAKQDKIAQQAYLDVIERNPHLTEPRNNLVMLLARQGKTKEALEYVRQTIEINPNDAKSHMLLGMLLQNQGESKAAKIEKALSKKLAKTSIAPVPEEESSVKPAVPALTPSDETEDIGVP